MRHTISVWFGNVAQESVNKQQRRLAATIVRLNMGQRLVRQIWRCRAPTQSFSNLRAITLAIQQVTQVDIRGDIRGDILMV